MFKICSQCKIKKDLSEYHWYSYTNKYTIRCKKCIALGSKNARKKYSLTEKGKLTIRKAAEKSYIKHNHKWKARAKVRYAIKIGIVKKPKRCEACKKVKLLQGHHPDYNKPLEVVFLCSRCHADLHHK